MAYIEKTPTGKYRVHVEKRGVRESETFKTKREAQEWGAKREAEIVAAGRGQFPRKTLGEVLDEYVQRFSRRKEGAEWEAKRVAWLKRTSPWLTSKVISETTTADWARWRDARAAQVKASTIVRDIALWSAVYHKATHELGPYVAASPLTHMDKPTDSARREVLWPWGETKKVLRELGHRPGVAPVSKAQEVAYVLLVGLRTAMRCGEILSLSSATVDMRTRVATLEHKMQYLTGRPRRVPMEKQAARLLGLLAGRGLAGGAFFTMTPGQVDGLFRKYRDRLMLGHLHIHDTRATAITRLARKVDVLTLSRITGIKDLRTLNERYYRERDEEIAARL